MLYSSIYIFWVAAIIALHTRRGREIFQRYVLNYLKKWCAWWRERERESYTRKPSIIRSPDKSSEVFELLVFGGYIKVSFTSSSCTRTRSPSIFSTCFLAHRRLSSQPRFCRCDSEADECTDKSRDFSFECWRLFLPEKNYATYYRND